MRRTYIKNITNFRYENPSIQGKISQQQTDQSHNFHFANMPTKDPRKVIGAKVLAKAIHVTCLAESTRRYGSNAKEKMVLGIVLEVIMTKTANNRNNASIAAKYDFGDNVFKVKTLNIRSVVASKLDIAEVVQDEVSVVGNGNNVDVLPLVSLLLPQADAIVVAPARSDTSIDTEETESENEDEPPAATVHADDGSAFDFLNDDDSVDEEESVADVPVQVAHEVDWFEDDAIARRPVNGVIPPRSWHVRTPVGDLVSAGSDPLHRHSRLQYFLFMFPPRQINLIHRLTNRELIKIGGQKEMTKGEMLSFFGVLILITRFEKQWTRASLWSTVAPSKYMPAASLGKTGMSRHRFDMLFRAMRFGEQPDQRPLDMTSEQFRWKLLDDFVLNFNLHRATTFIPSEDICVDESISRWYGLGGSWINIGLPQYIAMERKPDNGCEIQNAACGKSGVMLQLKLVKTAAASQGEFYSDNDNETTLLHGTQVVKQLVRPWLNSNRIICADSAFASVGCANELKRLGMRFIGVVKTATKQFPMKWLSEVELSNRGDRKGLVARNADGGDVNLLAFVWMDRDRRYFITNTSSLGEGTPVTRERWRQVNQEPNADPERVDLVVPQPLACEIYYSTNAAIDNHNRCRQDTLMLERKIETKDWSTRVAHTILGMIIVDSWMVYKAATATLEKQHDFYTLLAEELIDNTYDTVQGNTPTNADAGVMNSELLDRTTGAGRAGVDAHLTPTKQKRRRCDGTVTNHSKQGRCRMCLKKTRHICSQCKDDDQAFENPVMWLCHTETGRFCFPEHATKYH